MEINIKKFILFLLILTIALLRCDAFHNMLVIFLLGSMHLSNLPLQRKEMGREIVQPGFFQIDIQKSINFTMEHLNKCKHFIYEYYKEQVNLFKEGQEIVKCPPYFDGIVCWPATNTNQTATQPCPSAAISFDRITRKVSSGLTVKQRCLENGRWNIDNLQKYSMCMPNYASHVIISSDAWKYSWDLAGLMLIKDFFPTISYISYIGYLTSFAALILAMTIFCLFKKLRNHTNKLHMHLFVTFIMKAFMMLLKYWTYSTENSGLFWSVHEKQMILMKRDVITDYDGEVEMLQTCKAIVILWNYFVVANYSWMLMEGFYLCKLIFLPMSGNNSTIRFVLLGWGLPCLVIAVWATIRVILWNSSCWFSYEQPSLLLFIHLPITISVLINFLLFIYIVYALYGKLKTSGQLQQRRMQYKRWARSTTVLIPLFGAHYLIFMGLSYYDDHNVRKISIYCYQLLTAFQGAFVAVLYCLMNGEVKTEICRAWRIHWFKFSSSILGNRKLPELPNNRKREGNRPQPRPEDKDDMDVGGIAIVEISSAELS